MPFCWKSLGESLSDLEQAIPTCPQEAAVIVHQLQSSLGRMDMKGSERHQGIN
jgi:hypothetical protein